ncbi:hypothetical protein ENSA5_05090 [Enhygromyxa salina]|uniref:Uncharacterized protein n=1 Tax=Enhygromyxa salina TaxID=215803 RepID=A0A2S9YI10_9BACT|nr:hypothetical protein [Enhygromyxa salina]PRQ04744.1 hypothetical protein ENSA5_05090 [Enhygromyxa salina]
MSAPLTNQDPISLTAQDTAVGPRLFLRTDQLGTTLDDIFDENTILTNVPITISNEAGYTVDISFDSGSATPVADEGSITHTLGMPSAGACNSVNITMWSAGTRHHDPIIRIKRKVGSVTPTCS